MKSRTLITTTAAIIAVAAIILTMSLSLLNSSAVAESYVPTEPSIPEAEVEAQAEATPQEDVISEENIPAENNNSSVVDRDIYNGCIVIDIYEHATGNYVSQVVVDSDEAYNHLEKLVAECYESRVHKLCPYGRMLC